MQVEQYVRSADGTELYVSVEGSGVPLVLCDGLGCDGFIWRELRPAFCDRNQIVHPHYRGHGLSHPPADPRALGVEEFVEDLRLVMDALGIERAVLLGHSMGVQVILEFGLTHPDRAAGLVPVCGSYGRPLDTFHDRRYALRAFHRMLVLVRRFPSRAQRVWSRVLLSAFSYHYARLVEVNSKVIGRRELTPYLRHLASMDVRVFMELLGRLTEHSTEERLPDLNVPTLVVGGENDKFSPAWLSHRMHQLIPGAELLMIPTGTHVAPLEIPELLHLRLERFLDQRVQPFLELETRRNKKRAQRKRSANARAANPRPKKAVSGRRAGRSTGRPEAGRY